MSEVRYHTVTDTHPEHGAFEVTFRVLNDGRAFVLHPDRSTFPTAYPDDRLDCVEQATTSLTERFGDDISVPVNEAEL